MDLSILKSTLEETYCLLWLVVHVIALISFMAFAVYYFISDSEIEITEEEFSELSYMSRNTLE